ncbi:MAG: M14 family zinc carboxypeptidase [Silvibacterium sp.]
MTSRLRSLLPVPLLIAYSGTLLAQTNIDANYARDPEQLIDESYTQHIKQYTTESYFNSPLTDYLPASKTVPTPAKVLGDVSGAPGILPYAEDVYKYFRLLEKSTPRVKVFSIGQTEEGREMIAAAIADETLLAKMPENDARLAKLADPRTINMDDTKAAELVKASFPIYYITGTIHSPETGAPTALMELAYRLAVDDSPYIQYIRSHMVVLITPVVEVDGRDRMVDIYKWHLAHPGQQWPRLAYWGHYVAHDNNRDAMGMTLDLTRNVLDTNLRFHAQVLHDLHESVPFLYDNTVGDGPYNAWVDPLLNGEWQMLGWNNIEQMTAFGMPGVFTHGDFDTWSPGYLMFLAAMHNGISRLYETFGNGGADTEKRILDPDEYARTWFKPNPPLPVVTWSQRNNNNYEQTALLSTLSFFAQNGQQFLENYYTKSKRSVLKPQSSGPVAYVLNEPSSSRQAELLHTLALQHVEISRLSEPFTFTPPAKPEKTDSEKAEKDDASKEKAEKSKAPKPETFPTGSYIIRMDQPYSRIADALLDRQYWAPDDPQKHPYDDTGWSFGDLFHVKTVRVTDPAILKVKMEPVADPAAEFGKIAGSGSVYAVNNASEVSLLGLRYTLKDRTISVADRAFDAEGHHFEAGSLLIENADAAKLKSALADSGLNAVTLAALPSTPKHAAPLPRIAFIHTWLGTQTEGWWRLAFDKAHVPYDYISTQTVAQTPDLRSKYDVIIFAPVGRASTQQVINGMPMWGNPLPWEKTDLTPNLGRIDSTPDMRPGLTYAGVDHLKDFISRGGLFITSEDTAQFAIDLGLAPGVFVAPKGNVRVVGSVLGAVVVDKSSPVANGYGTDLGVYSADGMAFTVANTAVNRHIATEKDFKRPTGRGGPADDDIPEDRPYAAAPELPSPKAWEPTPLNEEEARNNVNLIPEQYRPQVILRFTSGKQFLLSGLLDGGSAIEEKPIVVDAHLGQGNVLLFANNPVYRGETLGSYALVFNAILNYDRLAKSQQTASNK